MKQCSTARQSPASTSLVSPQRFRSRNGYHGQVQLVDVVDVVDVISKTLKALVLWTGPVL